MKVRITEVSKVFRTYTADMPDEMRDSEPESIRDWAEEQVANDRVAYDSGPDWDESEVCFVDAEDRAGWGVTLYES